MKRVCLANEQNKPNKLIKKHTHNIHNICPGYVVEIRYNTTVSVITRLSCEPQKPNLMEIFSRAVSSIYGDIVTQIYKQKTAQVM